MTTYKFDTIKDYSKFKVELRKLENHLQEDGEKERKARCQATTKVEEKSELSEVKGLLVKLNKRKEKLEKGQQEARQAETMHSKPHNIHFFGDEGRGLRNQTTASGTDRGFVGQRGRGVDKGRGTDIFLVDLLQIQH